MHALTGNLMALDVEKQATQVHIPSGVFCIIACSLFDIVHLS